MKWGADTALADLGKRLARCVATTAGLERCFSTLGMMHGKYRVSLGSTKAGQLTMIYRNAKAMAKQEGSDSDPD